MAVLAMFVKALFERRATVALVVSMVDEETLFTYNG
jgi:hypothetical protein